MRPYHIRVDPCLLNGSGAFPVLLETPVADRAKSVIRFADIGVHYNAALCEPHCKIIKKCRHGQIEADG